MSDPIDRPDFNPSRARPANPARIVRIRELAGKWKLGQDRADRYREDLAEAIREARDAGHSYQQLAEAAGVSIGVIQRMVGK